MPRLIDRVPENRFVALFVGPSGAGKTVAEASFPKPCHFNDFDGRIGGAQVPWLSMEGITYDYYPPKEAGLVTKLNEKLEGLLGVARLSGANTGIELPKTYVTDSLTNQTYAFICQSIPLTHGRTDTTGHTRMAGKRIGPLNMAGPEDFGFEAQATYDYIAFLKSLPIPNMIVSAHYVDVYGKEDPDNEFSPRVIVGKRLSIRDKIGTNIQTHFDHVFEFDRKVDKYFVTFRGELARTSFSWLPNGTHEWTQKNFYEFMLSFKPKTEPAGGEIGK